MQSQERARILLRGRERFRTGRVEGPGKRPLGGLANDPCAETLGICSSRPSAEGAAKRIGLRDDPHLRGPQVPGAEVVERARELLGRAEESHHQANLARACYGHCAHWPDCRFRPQCGLRRAHALTWISHRFETAFRHRMGRPRRLRSGRSFRRFTDTGQRRSAVSDPSRLVSCADRRLVMNCNRASAQSACPPDPLSS
jgi:hypothetical protein